MPLNQGRDVNGIVYIVDFPDGWPNEFAYEGHWESPEARRGVVEDGPGWDDPEAPT